MPVANEGFPMITTKHWWRRTDTETWKCIWVFGGHRTYIGEKGPKAGWFTKALYCHPTCVREKDQRP